MLNEMEAKKISLTSLIICAHGNYNFYFVGKYILISATSFCLMRFFFDTLSDALVARDMVGRGNNCEFLSHP